MVMDKFSKLLTLSINWFGGQHGQLKVVMRDGVTRVTFEFPNGVTLIRHPVDPDIVDIALLSEGKELARATHFLNGVREVKISEAGKQLGVDAVEIEQLLDRAVRADTLPADPPEPSNTLNEVPQPVRSDMPSDIPPVLVPQS
jgi:hypothetical protein